MRLQTGLSDRKNTKKMFFLMLDFLRIFKAVAFFIFFKIYEIHQ